MSAVARHFMDVLQNHMVCWRRQPQLSALYFFIAELFYGNEDMMQWSFYKNKNGIYGASYYCGILRQRW